MSLEKEFVPYELAVKLKEFGFEFESLGAYLYKELFLWQDNDTTQFINFHVEAPLWQQAFDWFREKYGYSSIIAFNGGEHYYWWITECNQFGLDINSIDTHDFTTYEQSRHACLEKLIEIVSCKSEN